jgi:hypothetical protein
MLDLVGKRNEVKRVRNTPNPKWRSLFDGFFALPEPASTLFAKWRLSRKRPRSSEYFDLFGSLDANFQVWGTVRGIDRGQWYDYTNPWKRFWVETPQQKKQAASCEINRIFFLAPCFGKLAGDILSARLFGIPFCPFHMLTSISFFREKTSLKSADNTRNAVSKLPWTVGGKSDLERFLK